LSTELQAKPTRAPLGIIGASPPIREIRRMIRAIAPRLCTVLVTGESGTGKELVARAIHASGPRAEAPFIPVDCSSLTGTLFESQLFGHVKGSFTGAHADTEGFVRAADGGTLFLDEIGELGPPLQAKLLRVLQENEVVPVGSTRAVKVDVRVVAATNCDLEAMVRSGAFREDLYYRINVVHLHLPPLRQRREDIGRLADHFLAAQCRRYAEPLRRFSAEATRRLCAYRWPGNVRELINQVERTFVLSDGEVVEADQIHLPVAEETDRAASRALPTLEEAERDLIAEALRLAKGCKSEAARLLNIERRRLYRKVARFGLQALCRSG
jgi:two-component system response regulator AtoC